jgi:hypothetical protein
MHRKLDGEQRIPMIRKQAVNIPLIFHPISEV